MDSSAISSFRLDRRLALRRGWISPEDLERELEALPDVSAKIAPPSEAPDSPGEAQEPA